MIGKLLSALKAAVAPAVPAPPPIAPADAGRRLAQEANARRRARRSAWVAQHIQDLRATFPNQGTPQQ